MPQPSWWVSVRPPRMAKPVKLNTMSVGTLQFIPRSWHMGVAYHSRPGNYVGWKSVAPSDKLCQDACICRKALRFSNLRNLLMQQDWLAHQGIVRPEKVIDFLH